MLHRTRILVVDDNAAIHSDFQRILKVGPSRSSLEEHEAELFGDIDPPATIPLVELEVELTLAHQGEEGVELVREARARGEPYAVAFVDFRMPPGIDGVETIHRMFAEDTDVQAVFCTAYTDLSWKEIANRLSQVDRYLILKKPFEPMEVRQMAAALSAKWRHQRERARAHAALIEREAHLRALLDAQEEGRLLREREVALKAQVEALWALSTPIVPISRRAVVVPLVGEFDARRGERMRSALLSGIGARGTRVAILDVTGVPGMDERMAVELERTAGAVRLLGAEPVLTGLGPEAAQQLVALGVSLAGLKTFLTLQEGVAFALRRHKI
ncbi:response regulator [Sorangium sp. So ce134]